MIARNGNAILLAIGSRGLKVFQLRIPARAGITHQKNIPADIMSTFAYIIYAWTIVQLILQGLPSLAHSEGVLESSGTPITSWSPNYGFLIPVSNTVSPASRATKKRIHPYVAQPLSKQDSSNRQTCYTRWHVRLANRWFSSYQVR